jgi:hypothetical protein
LRHSPPDRRTTPCNDASGNPAQPERRAPRSGEARVSVECADEPGG